jgi:uncharacterized membrane protein YkoI
MKGCALALFLGLALAGAGVVTPVSAQGCVSTSEARAAAQAGQVAPLSQILGSIGQAVHGKVLPTPELCKSGDRYVYRINVLADDGHVVRVVVDAASGAILGE